MRQTCHAQVFRTHREREQSFLDQRDRWTCEEGGWCHWDEFLATSFAPGGGDDRASLWLMSQR